MNTCVRMVTYLAVLAALVLVSPAPAFAHGWWGSVATVYPTYYYAPTYMVAPTVVPVVASRYVWPVTATYTYSAYTVPVVDVPYILVPWTTFVWP